MGLALWNFYGLQRLGNQISLLSDTNHEFTFHLAVGTIPTTGPLFWGDFTEASFDGYSARVAKFNAGGFSGGDYYQLIDANPLLVLGSGVAWQAGSGVLASPETVTGYWVGDRDDPGGNPLWWREFDTPIVVDTPLQIVAISPRVRWRAGT